VVLSNIDYSKEYGEVLFGEINNIAYNQFSNSLDEYFDLKDLRNKNYILKKFGSFRFGEINNLLLSDYTRALNNFYLWY
jgi:hypothetical protein